MINPFGSRYSISVRLSFWYGVSSLILLTVFVVFLYATFDLSIHRDFEGRMNEAERLLMTAIVHEDDGLVLAESDSIQSVAYQTSGAYGTYVRLLSVDGDVTYRSPNFDGGETFHPFIPARASITTHIHEWDGTPVRSRYSPVRDRSGKMIGWLEITRLESTIHEELHRLEWILAVGIALCVLVAIVSGYGLAKRALLPVVSLTDVANQIHPTDLEQRLPSNFGVQDELTDLADAFNVMLDRLQSSFEREQRFRVDAAHAMFTPLSAMRSEIDVALHRSRDHAYYRSTLDAVRDRLLRLSDMLDKLLELSSAEGIKDLSLQTVDLSNLLVSRMERFEALAAERGVQLGSNIEGHVTASVQPSYIEVILDNLLTNAIKYTPREGSVELTMKTNESDVIIEVSDSGIGFSDEEREHLFDRFFRSREQSIQSKQGTGLGLPITKVLIELHGGHIRAFSSGPDGGSIFTVSLPVKNNLRPTVKIISPNS